MHEGADEGQAVIFLLGQKGQLAFLKAVEHDSRVGNEQVVAHQQKPAAFRGVFQTFRVEPHPNQLDQGFNIHIHDRAVEPVVLLLGLCKVNPGADEPQKEHRQRKADQEKSRKGHRHRPDRPSQTQI